MIVEELVAVLGYEIKGQENLEKFKSGLKDAGKDTESLSKISNVQAEAVAKLAMGVLKVSGATVMALMAMNKGFAANEEKITSWANTSGEKVKAVTSLWISAAEMAQRNNLPVEVAEDIIDQRLASGASLIEILRELPGLLMITRVEGAKAANDIANAWGKLGTRFGFTREEMAKFNDQLRAGGSAGSFETKDLAKHGPSAVAQSGDLLASTPDGMRVFQAVMNTLAARAGNSDQGANWYENIAGKLNDPNTKKKLKEKGVDVDFLKGKRELWDKIAEWAANDQAGVDAIFKDRQANAGIKALGQSAKPEFKDQSFGEFYKKGEAVNGATANALATKLDSSAAGWTRVANSLANFGDALGLLASGPAGAALHGFAATIEAMTKPIQNINDFIYGDGAKRAHPSPAPGDFGLKDKPAPGWGSSGAFGLNEAKPFNDPSHWLNSPEITNNNNTTQNISVSAPVTVNVQQAAQAPGAVGSAVSRSIIRGASSGAEFSSPNPGRMQGSPAGK